ncbi:MAG: HlyD family efflux transporter periplasmic adaptor subunit [Planctomycetaceae bacterium]|nr:HlyD family efflux transporter periplasmic adaptor subunit [Planctomycetaceae bacterium]
MRISTALVAAIGMSCLALGAIQAEDEVSRIDVDKPVTKFTELATFSTERGGILEQVPAEGDRLAADELVIRLKSDAARAALKVAEQRAMNEGEILVAEKASESAWLEYRAAVEANRLSPDPNDPAYPETHIARLKLAAESADAKVVQAKEQKRDFELQRDQAKTELESYEVKSHFGGFVTKLLRHKGEGVQQGEPIVEVINTSVIRVEGYVLPAESIQLRAGMKVHVTAEIPQQAGGPKIIETDGVLGYVDVRERAFNDVKVWAEIPNESGLLKEGMKVSMYVLLKDAEPTAAKESPPN